MSFDKSAVKSAMIRDKAFLKELFSGNSLTNLKTLKSADDVQLNTLIKILYFVANGEIKVKENFREASKKISILRKFVENKSSAQKLIKDSRLNKIQFLKHFIDHFQLLLYHIFNEN